MKSSRLISFTETRKRKNLNKVYETSVTTKKGCIFFLVLEDFERKLVILCPLSERDLVSRFDADEDGEIMSEGRKVRYLVCPCNHHNVMALRQIFSFMRPQVIGLTPAIGMGDRLGLATPGHIRAVRETGVFPVFAQQSVREMDRTLRTPMEVLDDVSWAVFQEGYRKGFAADADHLKKKEDVYSTFEAGFTMYTIDPSDYVDNNADMYDLRTLNEKFEKLPWKELWCTREAFTKMYVGRRLLVKSLDKSLDLELSEETLLRAAVKYLVAVAYAFEMYKHLKTLFGRRRFDVEISVDETEKPTSPPEHFFIISELKRLGLEIQGLAPRFVGRFEKAIDYKGNLKEFEESFGEHVLIAKACGPYKLSIHSGSDKFSIYPIAGKFARDMVHLKTAGTSYLEALRLVARHEPCLFREIVQYGLKCFEKDRKSYSVTTNLSLVPNPKEIPDEDLEKTYLDDNNGRQLLHITYGSILTARTSNNEWIFRERIRNILIQNEEEHCETVAEHMKRHMIPLWFSVLP